MPLVLANRVQETGTANTTVSFTLTGAVTGFQSFAVIGNTNTTYYSATDGAGNWEVGLGTYSTTGPTLTRTTVYASSNSNLAVTFSGAVNVFVTYPSGRSVNLDETGNVSALGTVSSGVWQGSTVGVAYGGTGVTASSGANSVMIRDANQNVSINRLNQANQTTTAAGGTTALTAASSYIHTLVGTGGQTYTMPDATTLTTGVAFVFNNMATGTLTLQDYAAGAIGTIPNGGAGAVFLTDNSTTGGTWDIHAYLPEGVTFGTNAFNLGSSVVSGGTWQGGTIQPAYGGTGLTTFTGANRALYSTGATTLTAGTLPVVAGGTGVTTTPANGQLLIGNGSSYTVASLGTGTGISTTTGAGTLTINNTGVTSLAGTSPVSASASTGAVTVSLASGYGDTQNPYASKTANFFLAAPNGSAGAPTFRAIVAADIPTLNQNTTGSAGSVANAVTFNNGGSGGASGSTFNGSGALTVSYNTIGAPSTTGTNATGTWAINISGNAATATSATSATNASNLTGGNISGAMTGTMAAGSQVLELANNDNYLSARVIRNNASTSNRDGMYIGYGNSNSGLTRIYGGGATSGGIEITGSGVNNVTIAGNIALNAGNYNSYSPTLTGGGASGTWGISISGNAATATSTPKVSTYDLRSTALTPSYFGQGLSTAFMANSTDGLNDGGTYHGIIQFQQWSDSSGGGAAEIAITDNNNVWHRGSSGGLTTWSTWYKFLDSGNYNSYSPTLTGGGASGTWGISISGNAATASNASLLNSISAVNLYNNMGDLHGTRTSFDATTPSYGFGYRYVQGSTNGPGTGGTQYYSWYIGLGSDYPATGAGSYGAMFAIDRNVTTPYLSVRYNESNSFSAWRKIAAGYADSAGNAGNTSSISNAVGGSYTWTGVQYFQSNQNTASGINTAPLQAYATGGNGAIMAFHRAGVYAINMGLDSDNVFRIGGWSASANRLQMDMSGNLTAAGNVTAYSDERLKKDWQSLPDDYVYRLTTVKNGTYTRIDSGERQAGSSAQDWQKLLPEVVSEDNNGTLSVAYSNAALVSVIELAKRVVDQEARIAKLEALVAALSEK